MEPTPSRSRAFALSAGLAALTLLAYAGVARNQFINLDDNDYVTQNVRVQAGITWRGVVWAFTTGHSANWHPLTWLSHMLDCELFGLDPTGHHLVNLLVHVATALLLFRLFLKTTRAPWPSAFVAATFALHPLHVESVAWIAERKDVLAAFFWVLTTLAYVRWLEGRGRGRYLAVVGSYALGLLSKPMLVTLPFTLLLLDLWPLGRSGNFAGLGKLVGEKAPLFLLAFASSVVTFFVQRDAGAMTLSDHVPFALRAANALVAYASYLGKAFWPSHLAVYYPHAAEALRASEIAGAAAILGAATWAVLRVRARRPWLAVGWLWFLGTLVPVIGLVQVGSQAMADRYTYVPLIGISVAVAFDFGWFAERCRAVRIAASVLLAAAVAAWTGLTARQIAYWRDDLSLFGHVVEVMPENHLAHGILGNVHLRERQFDLAMSEYETALRIRPTYAQAHSNMGMALELSGRPEEAILKYEEALRISPTLAEAHHNLGRLLAAYGRLLPAITHLEAAVRSNPDLVEVRINLGNALMLAGRRSEAIEQFEKALELRPGDPQAQRKLDAARRAGPVD